MMRTAPLFPLIALWLVSCQGPTGPAPSPAPSPAQQTVDVLGKYRQLAGSWMDSTTSDRYTMFEAWQIQDDSTLIGRGYALAGKDTVFVEDLRLEVRDDLPTYKARVARQNNGSWVPFQAQAHGDDSLVFENPGHDYPQCISYTRAEAGHWDVVVSGTENGADRQDRSHLVLR